MNNIKKLVLVVFILIANSCANHEVEIPRNLQNLENLTVYSADTGSKFNIDLSEERVFGVAEDKVIGELADFEVDQYGRVYMADSDQMTVHVFDTSGSEVATLGRGGRGPGEFQRIEDLQLVDGALYVEDSNLNRGTVFELQSMSYLRSINLQYSQNDIDEMQRYTGAYYSDYLVNNRDQLMLRFISFNRSNIDKYDTYQTTDHFYILNHEGELSSQKWLEIKSDTQSLLPVGPAMIRHNPAFFGSHYYDLSDDGKLYTTSPPELLVKTFDSNGNYLRAFYYPFDGVPITNSNAQQAGVPGYVLQGMTHLDLPDSWPAIQSMLLDDKNRIWIATIVEDFDVYEWWVLDDHGALLGQFRWPRNRRVEVVRNGKLYALEEDTTTGITEVVRYDIALETK